MGEALLQVENVSRTFWQRQHGRAIRIPAVTAVSFDLGASGGELLSLVGESGSGKSTVGRLLLGLDRPTSGSVRYRGRDISTLRGREVREFRREVQGVFQDPYSIYNPFYMVDRVLEQPVRRFRLAGSPTEGRRLIEAALRAVDLRPADVLGRFPHQLSGGERQRVMLARLYLIRPRLVIADEPVSMIDAALRIIFLNILLDFRDQGMSCLFITHNLETSYYLGGDVLVLYGGHIVERASADEVLETPAHPYTQLLVRSIPAPDPRKRWAPEREDWPAGGASPPPQEGCPFCPRCPHALVRCAETMPEPRRAAGGRSVACHLYESQAARESDEEWNGSSA